MSQAIFSKCMWCLLWWQGFQSTRPHGARQLEMQALDLASEFQSTRPLLQRAGHVMFQSTRPHGARRVLLVVREEHRVVSIHAPARGATFFARRLVSDAAFQSTRPHGARLRCCHHYPRHQHGFNPRARTGRDRRSKTALWTSSSFNPRARTGRDQRVNHEPSLVKGFNPRARTGRDSGWRTPNRTWSCFNPRARTGRDDRSIGQPSAGASFNPRARTGRDIARVLGLCRG